MKMMNIKILTTQWKLNDVYHRLTLIKDKILPDAQTLSTKLQSRLNSVLNSVPLHPDKQAVEVESLIAEVNRLKKIEHDIRKETNPNFGNGAKNKTVLKKEPPKYRHTDTSDEDDSNYIAAQNAAYEFQAEEDAKTALEDQILFKHTSNKSQQPSNKSTSPKKLFNEKDDNFIKNENYSQNSRLSFNDKDSQRNDSMYHRTIKVEPKTENSHDGIRYEFPHVNSQITDDYSRPGLLNTSNLRLNNNELGISNYDWVANKDTTKIASSRISIADYFKDV
jgi:hypothetical protein